MRTAVREILENRECASVQSRPRIRRLRVLSWEPHLRPGTEEEWGHSIVIGLANNNCAYCKGRGWNRSARGYDSPCNCVFRAVFRACFNRYREYRVTEPIGRVDLSFCPSGKSCKMHYSRKREEYLADFVIIASRVLDELSWRLFDLHMLQGRDYKECVRLLGLDRRLI